MITTSHDHSVNTLVTCPNHLYVPTSRKLAGWRLYPLSNPLSVTNGTYLRGNMLNGSALVSTEKSSGLIWTLQVYQENIIGRGAATPCAQLCLAILTYVWVVIVFLAIAAPHVALKAALRLSNDFPQPASKITFATFVRNCVTCF